MKELVLGKNYWSLSDEVRPTARSVLAPFGRFPACHRSRGKKDVVNNVIHKTKSLKLLVHEGNGGVLAQFKLEFARCQGNSCRDR